MPRPTTKQELLTAADNQFEKLFALIDAMPQRNQTAAFCFDTERAGKEAHWARDKNIRDVLIHLHEWHMLLLNFVNANQSGEAKPFLPEPYNWKTYGDMNARLWEKHQSTSYAQSREMLKNSHKAVAALIEAFNGDELFTKGFFKWTGGTSLGGYCVSVTSSHYDWAVKKIKLQIKALADADK
ncbi:MAG: ClbS/DfsB family four-helix bundle protein [Oscillospiraceae bacterium]|jgi:hypothetical protein|nr:ClbS/DfsB family four-helix bundle protein [Oscillospiraceae bacterium]